MAKRKRKLTFDDIRVSPGGLLIAAPAWAYERKRNPRTLRLIAFASPIPELWEDITPELRRRRDQIVAEENAWRRSHGQRPVPLGGKASVRYPDERARRTCPVCKQEFYGLGPTATCSERSARARRTATRTRGTYTRPHVTHDPRPCPQCGETFTPRRSDAVYCSPRCRLTHHRSTPAQSMHMTEERDTYSISARQRY